MRKILKCFGRCFSQSSRAKVSPDKFKGCLVGSLIGDCYGKPYKLSDEVSKVQLQKYFDKLDGPPFKAPFKPYTSSTALSNCVASSLASLKQFDASEVSKRFVKEFFEYPHRDYGENLSKIFLQLRGSKFADPFLPAREQYFGMGSYGNAAAARVAPIALFYCMDQQKMAEIVGKASNLTNSNKLGRDGALVQSWAIRIALIQDVGSPVDAAHYLTTLLDVVKSFETDEEGLDLKDVHRFQEQLEHVKKLLAKDSPTEEEVVSTLGHARVAVYSVPTAIYCFLRGLKAIPGVETSNPFRRTVQYAIALGGDADTIASMAGAIAGACYGHASISERLQNHCEGLSTVISLAEKLAISAS